jgi:hypothetical protein
MIASDARLATAIWGATAWSAAAGTGGAARGFIRLRKIDCLGHNIA